MNKETLKELLEKNKEKFIKYANLTNEQIRDIWIQPGENTNCVNIDENNTWLVSYQKFILKFNSYSRKITRFYKYLSPGNKDKLLNYFGLNNDDDLQLMNFFDWITCDLGIYRLINIETGETEPQNIPTNKIIVKYPLVRRWVNSSDIVFYFDSDSQTKDKLISKYFEHNELVKK